jgi:XTP/dITP diphosphohydrolase
MRLLFASQNKGKIAEIVQLLPAGLELLGLSDVGYADELEETGSTLEANALQKAWFVHRQFGYNCFSDDSGLEVTALQGAPGVDSAHYAGPGRNNEDNIRLLLKNLEKTENRSARFRSVFALIWDGEAFTFEGTVAGTIIRNPRGTGGFGYDPIFQPEGHARTFAEMAAAEKNQLSHRARALSKMLKFLKEKSI